MAKVKTLFVCNVCGYDNPKWLGKCPNCNAWNSFEEKKIPGGAMEISHPAQRSVNEQSKLAPQAISEVLETIKTHPEKRFYPFSSSLLNQFWGGEGLVAGSLTLLAGEPGLGKSTFSLQILRSLYQSKDPLKLLYITAEESVFELARRSQRLNIPKEIMVLQSNQFEQIAQVIEEFMPHVVVIDSVQTIYSAGVSSSPGSVAQVSTIATQLLAISKARNVSVVLVGHVTKDGQIAGPKTLEHLVDSVLLLESSESNNYRTLSFSKHRFGSIDSLLLMKMEQTGLEIVTDPSLALLENLETGVGVVYSVALDKDLPLIVEVQVLVSPPLFTGQFGRREAIGMPVSRVNTILAIADKYLGVSLKNQDVYVQLVGLPKNRYDDSLDLALLLAILSSVSNKTVETMVKQLKKSVSTQAKKMVFAGRLTLSGNVRVATHDEVRKNTAHKLGFDYNQGVDMGNLETVIKKMIGEY